MSNVTREMIFSSLALVCAVVASVFDIRMRKIPNVLTGTSILLALGFRLAFGGWLDAGSSVLAGLLTGGAVLLFYLAGGMGAGDVKLMTAVGCFVGLHSVITVLFATALCGAAFGLAVAFKKGVIQQTARNTIVLLQHHLANGLRPHPELSTRNTAAVHMPFAVPIMAGCLITTGIQFWSVQS